MNRVAEARDLFLAGKVEEALAVLRAEYEKEAAQESRQMRLVLISVISDLARKDPRATALLADLRDSTLARMQQLGAGEAWLTPDFFLLNQVLGETDISVQFYDALPAEDARRRHALGLTLYPAFVASGRYEDAGRVKPLVAMFNDIRSIATMNAAVDPVTQAPLPLQLRPELAMNLEVLAATRRYDDLGAFLTRLLESDRAPATLALLREQLGDRPDAALVLEKVIEAESWTKLVRP